MPFARLFAVLRGWRQRELDHWRLELPRTPYRIWLERSRISFSCAPKNPDSLIYQTAITMWRAPGKKDWPNVFWGFTLRVSLFWCVVLMWQFHTSMLKKWYKQFLGCHVLFFWWLFLFVDFGIKKKTWCFFFWVSGTTSGTSLGGLAGLPTSYQAALSAAGGAGAGAAITGAMEAEKTEKPRKKSKWDQASGGGGKHQPGWSFFPPGVEFFFFKHKKKGLDIFWKSVVLFLVWGWVGWTNTKGERELEMILLCFCEVFW